MKPSLLAAVLSLSAACAWAAPSRMRPIEVTAPDGSVEKVIAVGDEHAHHYISAATGAEATWLPRCRSVKSTPAMKARAKSPQRVTTFPTLGNFHFLVVLVEFADRSFSLSDPVEEFSAMLNEPGFSRYKGNGSVADFYRDCSAGQFQPVFDVVGPIRMSRNVGYYGGGSDDSAAGLMVVEACKALSGSVDLGRYDIDGDGQVDNIYFYYAGKGEADGGAPETIWPHSWNLSDQGREYSANGVSVDAYACSPELDGEGKPNGIGTFCHEFGHVLGLPDLYSSSYSNALDPGTWSLMAGGNYNDDGRTPPALSSYERLELGWLLPRELHYPLTVTLEPLTESNTACRIPSERANEYFLLENRQQQGWDATLPGHGMLVWHIDYNPNIWDRNVVNHNAAHQYVDIVEANNATSHSGDSGFTFPGADNRTEFTSTTSPALKSWSGTPIDCPVTAITETAEGNVTFNVCGGKTPVGAISNITISNIGQETARLDWNAAIMAERYCVSISHDNTTVFETEVTTTSADVDGLWPGNEYTATVFAADKYEHGPSATLAFATPAPDFAHCAVGNLQFAPAAPGVLCAKWQPMDGAESYEVTFFEYVPNQQISQTCSFDNKELPTGWTSEATSWTSVDGYCGAAAPAIRFAADNSALHSPIMDSDIAALTLTMRASSLTEGTRLIVNGMNADNAEIFSTELTPSTTLGHYSVTFPDMGVRAISLEFARTGRSVLSIDDIIITIGGYEARELISENTGTQTLAELHGVANGAMRGVSVTAISANGRSLPSPIVTARASDSDAIIEPLTVSNTQSDKIYDLQGRRLRSAPRNAPYIRNCRLHLR